MDICWNFSIVRFNMCSLLYVNYIAIKLFKIPKLSLVNYFDKKKSNRALPATFCRLARGLWTPPSPCWDEQGLFQIIRAPPGECASTSGKWLFKPGLVDVPRAPQRDAGRSVLSRVPFVFSCWWIKVKSSKMIRKWEPVCSVSGRLVH